MAKQTDTIPLPGGKLIIDRRTQGRLVSLRCRPQSADKRVRRSLKTSKSVEAVGKADAMLVEMLTKQRQGIRVVSGSIGVEIELLYAHQLERYRGANDVLPTTFRTNSF